MKLIVVGGVAGGASAAARARRIDSEAEIVIYEKGGHVSFSNCSLPYYLSGIVESHEDLIMMFPEDFKNNHDIDVYTRHEVTAVNRQRKTVTVKNLDTGREFEDSYDKLILSPGAGPLVPAGIKGADGKNVFTIRNVDDISRLKGYLDAAEMEKTVVIGGGFIGIEAAENLRKAGKRVTVVEGTPQIMAPYDYDMVQILHKELYDQGIELHLKTTVTAIEPDKVTAVKDGETLSIEADAVIMAVGVTPETALAQNAGLEIGNTGGIKVNHNYQSSDPDIYAVGDVIESYNSLTHKPGRIPLAGPAQRQARTAAGHIFGIPGSNKGFIGSSCIKLFNLNAACTGLNEKTAEQEGFSFDSVMIFPMDKVGLMPGADYMVLKLIFEVPTGKILGAQAIGTGETDKRIDVIAAMITMGGTLEDLKELELCYAPSFSTAKDAVNMAALVGLNVLYGAVKQIHVGQVRSLCESGACIIDVRSPEEFEEGHLKCAKNIPLSQLRGRIDEIPKDIPVYLHCRSSQRSYYASCLLRGKGFENIINISGSFLGISLYEYFNDKTLGREPIVTKYNFD